MAGSASYIPFAHQLHREEKISVVYSISKACHIFVKGRESMGYCGSRNLPRSTVAQQSVLYGLPESDTCEILRIQAFIKKKSQPSI